MNDENPKVIVWIQDGFVLWKGSNIKPSELLFMGEWLKNQAMKMYIGEDIEYETEVVDFRESD